MENRYDDHDADADADDGPAQTAAREKYALVGCVNS